jgi:lactate dehydrogenase-like 2-hydroxyacid dehydrogenase
MAQKKKILVTGRLPDEVMEQLDAACDMEANREDRPMEREHVLEKIAGKEGLLSMITDRVDAELMDRAPDLKVISNLAVGTNNIDVAAATARGVAVTNTPGVTTEPTADLTLGRGNSSTGRPCSFWAGRSRERPWGSSASAQSGRPWQKGLGGSTCG